MEKGLWLIGTSGMAKAYANVLQALNADFKVIGRSTKSVQEFTHQTGIDAFSGGLENALNTYGSPKKAIVAIGILDLEYAARLLIDYGCSEILLEKPGSLTIHGLRGLDHLKNKKGSKIWIAYNRRCYESVRELKRRVKSDGGILSLNFEFTEWAHKIKQVDFHSEILDKWLISNSSHVLDLAFYLIGQPDDAKSSFFHNGTLSWHKSGARFHGAGITEKNIPFSYHADWESSGRWGLEILTAKNKYILQPLEELNVIPLGTLDIANIEIANELDLKFKPGLFRQTHEFLNSDTSELCSIEDQIRSFSYYTKIAGYQ